jgi:sugar phosphate permease
VSPLRWRVYALTWISYATYYLGRKSLGVTKARLKSGLGLTTADLGDIDTAYLSAYAVGQFVNGYLGDRVGSRRLVAAGMTLSALACAAFGLSAGLGMFLALMVVNGLAQSTGWPGTTRAMAAWTTPENRGAIMGWWTTCYQVGGLVATALATWLLHRSGWRAAYVGPALGLALVGALVLFALPDEPRVETAKSESSGASPEAHARRRSEPSPGTAREVSTVSSCCPSARLAQPDVDGVSRVEAVSRRSSARTFHAAPPQAAATRRTPSATRAPGGAGRSASET